MTNYKDDFGSGNALDAAYGAAWPRTPLEWCQQNSIPRDAASKFGVCGGGRVLIERGRYQPCPEGEAALVLAVRGDPSGDIECDDPLAVVTGGPMLDLIAVPLRRPTTWALRRGVVTFLGAVEPQFVSPPPVRVHRTPFAWLRSGCDGIAILTDDWGEQCDILMRIRRPLAEDVDHAKRLARVIARREFEPTILVPRKSRAKAAA